MSNYVSHPFDLVADTFFQVWADLITLTSNVFFNLPMLQNSGSVGGAGSKNQKIIFASLLCVDAHSLCIFDHAFLPHPKLFFVQFFFIQFMWMPLSTHEIFLSIIEES
jgi:hypothetical protein